MNQTCPYYVLCVVKVSKPDDQKVKRQFMKLMVLIQAFKDNNL